MDEKQYNALVELIKGTNERIDLLRKDMDARLDETNQSLDLANERISMNNERLNVTNERLGRHIEEINRRYTNMENIIIGRNQIRELEMQTMRKENETLEELIISVKQNSEERDNILDSRLRVANL